MSDSGTDRSPTHLTLWSTIFPDKLTVPQLVRELPAFCGIRSFITVLKEPSNCPYSELVETNAHPPCYNSF